MSIVRAAKHRRTNRPGIAWRGTGTEASSKVACRTMQSSVLFLCSPCVQVDISQIDRSTGAKLIDHQTEQSEQHLLYVI